jgi:cytochrome c
MQTLRLSAVLFVTFVAATGSANAQDAAAGEKVFAACRACHQVGPTAKNGVGPELNGLIGRAAGSAPNYAYSTAMKGSGLTWDEPTFDEYIMSPKAKVPGTKMAYPGLKDEQKINDLIAYLKQFDASGQRQ